MKAVFLDIDGVLNSGEYFESDRCVPRAKRRGTFMETMAGDLDPVAVRRLNAILGRAEAVVVVSSTWRHLWEQDELQRLLETRGFEGTVVGVTPWMPRCGRGGEVEWWVRCGPADMESFVALDDAHPVHMRPVESRHVWTPWRDGLLDHHVDEAVRILNAVETEDGVLSRRCACGFWVPRSLGVLMGETGRLGIVHYECPRCLTTHAEFVAPDGRVMWSGTAAPVQAPSS